MSPDPVLQPGLSARVELIVTDADTAQALGSGDVPVLATPRVLALMEAATVAATRASLPGGMTTVGVRAEIDHLLATPVGRRVVADAKLSKVDGRKLMFDVTLHDGGRVAADGRVERILVDRHRFVSRAFAEPAASGGAGPGDRTAGPGDRTAGP